MAIEGLSSGVGGVSVSGASGSEPSGGSNPIGSSESSSPSIESGQHQALGQSSGSSGPALTSGVGGETYAAPPPTNNGQSSSSNNDPSDGDSGGGKSSGGSTETGEAGYGVYMPLVAVDADDNAGANANAEADGEMAQALNPSSHWGDVGTPPPSESEPEQPLTPSSHWGDVGTPPPTHAEEETGFLDRVYDGASYLWNGAKEAVLENPFVEGTIGTVNDFVNAPDQIDQLNSDGDTVVIDVSAQFKLQFPTKIGKLGPKGEYGYVITVEQVGDAPPAGSSGDEPVYEVTFSKELMGGVVDDLPTKGVKAGVEVGATTVDSVTMQFESAEEAKEAISLLQKLAIDETLVDGAGQGAPILEQVLGAIPGSQILDLVGVADTAVNPLTDNQDGLYTAGFLPDLKTPDLLSGFTDLTNDEWAHLQDNIVSYTTSVDGELRGKIGQELKDSGIELRLDGNIELERTVILPKEGEPGRVEYTYTQSVDGTVKEKGIIKNVLKIQNSTFGLSPANVHEIGAASSSTTYTFELPPGATDFRVNGMPVPELSGLGLGELVEISSTIEVEFVSPYTYAEAATDDFDFQDPLNTLQQLPESILKEAAGRTNIRTTSVTLTIHDPGENAGQAIEKVFQGDLEGAIRSVGADAELEIKTERVDRDGPQAELEPSLTEKANEKELFKFKIGLKYENGVDDIIEGSQVEVSATASDLADVIWGPSTVTASAPPLANSVVFNDDPSLAQARGEIGSDETYEAYLPIIGNGEASADTLPADETYETYLPIVGTGDSPSDIVTPPPSGDWGNDPYDGLEPPTVSAPAEASPGETDDPIGRSNPDLRNDGDYEVIVVESGDTIWDIALNNDLDFQEVLELNGGHIADPDLIFAGDEIYIPKAETSVPADSDLELVP